MHLFSFKKPKKTIVNLLFLSGIFTLSISILACLTVILWINFPNIVKQFDKIDFDFYTKRIESLYAATKENKNIQQQYTHYLKLYEKLKDISILNKYYSYRQQSSRFLIQYYLKNNQLTSAMNIAENWEKQYPFDLEGKFEYINVLFAIDEKKAFEYYKQFYNKYKDIEKVKNNYIIFLMDKKKYNLAFIPFLLKNVAGRTSLNQADGIHPNAVGHKIIANTIFKSILEQL